MFIGPYVMELYIFSVCDVNVNFLIDNLASLFQDVGNELIILLGEFISLQKFSIRTFWDHNVSG